MNNFTKERNETIDVIKGLAIFLMLWGHCIQYCFPTDGDFFLDVGFKVIYCFHMPLLMLISGYLFRISSQKNGDRLLERKTSALVKPIIGGTVFVFLFTNVLMDIVINHKLTMLIDGKWLDSLRSLWFLWSVLGATIVFCFVEKYAKKWYQHLALVLLGILFVAMLPDWQMNLFMYPYFVIGYYFAKFQDALSKVNWIKYISIPLFPTMMLFYDKRHYIYTTGLIGGVDSLKEQIFVDAYRWVIGLVGCAFAITIVDLLLKVKFIKKHSAGVAKLGQKSLQIYIVSVVFLSTYLPIGVRLVRKVGFVDRAYDIVTGNAIVYDLVFALILAVIYAIVLMGIVKLMEKLKVSKLVFGR